MPLIINTKNTHRFLTQHISGLRLHFRHKKFPVGRAGGKDAFFEPAPAVIEILDLYISEDAYRPRGKSGIKICEEYKVSPSKAGHLLPEPDKDIVKVSVDNHFEFSNTLGIAQRKDMFFNLVI